MPENLNNAYFVFENYNYDILCEVISKKVNTPFEQVREKTQLRQLNSRLEDLGNLTLLVEYEYVESSYLRDFEDYYGGCFYDYSRKSMRIHFLKGSFNNKAIEAHIQSINIDDQLQAAYLGYLVINPIPDAFIGRSCLDFNRLSNDDGKKQADTCILSFLNSVNLFGISLHLDGVPFIEQDKVTSACASSALWVMLKALNKESSNTGSTPSPSKITQIAKGNIPNEGEHGLTIPMMINAVETMGYRCKSSKHIDPTDIKMYLEAGFPVVLGLKVKSYPEDAYHAVCIIGYLCDPNRGDTFIVHDDQRGMYLEVIITESEYYISGEPPTPKYQPHQYSVPLEKSIRNSKNTVTTVCSLFLDHLCEYITNDLDTSSLTNSDSLKNSIEKFYFSVSLKSNSDLKSRYRSSVDTLDKVNVLTKSWPKYVWVSDFYLSDSLMFSILFDTTDMDHGVLYLDVVYFNSSIKEALKHFIQDLSINLEKHKEIFISYTKVDSEHGLIGDTLQNFENAMAKAKSAINTYFRFIEKLALPKNPREHILIKMFGHPKPPTSFHAGEKADGIKQLQKPIFEYPTCTHNTASGLESLPINRNLYLDKTEKYIYAIDEDGHLIIGEDIPKNDTKLGHPSLRRNLWARIAGDLHFCNNSNQWLINIRSGRYGSHSTGIHKIHLENVATLLNLLLEEDQVSIDPNNEESFIHWWS